VSQIPLDAGETAKLALPIEVIFMRKLTVFGGGFIVGGL